VNQRTLNYVLIGSITLNAFLLGIFSMHLFSKRGAVHERGKHWSDRAEVTGSITDERGPRLLRGLVRAAGGPKDPRVQALFSGHRHHLAPVRKDIEASRERVSEALRREPFDRQALATALNDALAARHKADQLANQGALELAEQLTAAERASLRAAPGSSDGPERRRRTLP
jgi:hypothetical protein